MEEQKIVKDLYRFITGLESDKTEYLDDCNKREILESIADIVEFFKITPLIMREFREFIDKKYNTWGMEEKGMVIIDETSEATQDMKDAFELIDTFEEQYDINHDGTRNARKGRR